jgi:cytochrome c peroxidase
MIMRASLGLLVLIGGCGASLDGDHEPLQLRQSKHLVAEVRDLAAGRGIGPLEPAPFVRAELVELGRVLAFDKELSGNRNISCMTCHPPSHGTSDGRSLSIGQGGTGLGPSRIHPDTAFIPRNAPSLVNLHASDSLFWDGRVHVSGTSVVTPAGNQITPTMKEVFEFGAASVLGLFPVISREEMRAFSGNELANFADDDFTGIWTALMQRLGEIPEYVQMFESAYPGTDFEDMTFAHASNAIGGFLVSELSFTDTPWDQFLLGDDQALQQKELRGAKNFLAARCSICHGGDNLGDDDFHNVALAQLGPGAGDGLDGRDDFGRMRVSQSGLHRYLFRSTPLRNVELTGPYGHAGQFVSLADFIDHYSESDLKLHAYDRNQLEPVLRDTVLDNADTILATRDPLLDDVVLDKKIISDLTSFMAALTDADAVDLDHIVPSQVPSGLPVDD